MHSKVDRDNPSRWWNLPTTKQLMVCSHFFSYAAVPVICKNNAWVETIDGPSTITYLKVPCKVVHHQNQAASFNYRCVHPPIFSGLGRNLWRVLEGAANLPALTLKAVRSRVTHLWEKNVRNRFQHAEKLEIYLFQNWLKLKDKGNQDAVLNLNIVCNCA